MDVPEVPLRVGRLASQFRRNGFTYSAGDIVWSGRWFAEVIACHRLGLLLERLQVKEHKSGTTAILEKATAAAYGSWQFDATHELETAFCWYSEGAVYTVLHRRA